MTKYCIGCGVELQCVDGYEDGYVNPSVFDSTVMCKRCFRLKHYGEYKVTNKPSSYYKNIIKEIFNLDALVLHIVDIFNMGNMEYIYNQIFSSSILVISKIDIVPKSVNLDKLTDYFKKKYPKYKDIVLISSEKNYNMDLLYETIMKHKNGMDVYVLGNTNAGKSTFINKMIKDYTDNTNFIVTSCMPATTLNVISVKINEDLTLLDTPGIVDEGDIITHLDEELVKEISVKKEMKPRIYQIKTRGSLIVNKIGRVDVMDDSNLSIYISNNVDIYKGNFETNEKYKSLELTKIKAKKDEDLVIEGLCFIKCMDDTLFEVYMPMGTNIYTRDKLIG